MGKVRNEDERDGSQPNGGATGSLEKIIELCKTHNIVKIEMSGIKLEFGPQFQKVEMTDDEIRTQLQKFRPTADEQNKDFEKTLYWSA